jgi:heat shock protein HslJ
MNFSSLLLPCLLILTIAFCGCTAQPVPVAPSVPVTYAIVEQTSTVSATPIVPQSIRDITWKLGWYDDTKGIWSSVISGSTITATFGNDEKVRGSGGCNAYSTDFHLGNAPKIWIRRPVVQDIECSTPTGVMHQESAYFTDLSRGQNYTLMNGQLLIFDSENRRILQFDPMV